MMGNPKASSVAPLAPVASHERAPEQPRDFHFAVTWVTLFTHLDLIQASGPRTPAASGTTRRPSGNCRLGNGGPQDGAKRERNFRSGREWRAKTLMRHGGD